MGLFDELPEIAALGARTAPRAARYALPWEEQEQPPARPANLNSNPMPWEVPWEPPARQPLNLSGTPTATPPPAARYPLPWEIQPAPAPVAPGMPPAAPPGLDLPPEPPGLLSQIGDVLDRPGNALRGVLSGNFGALKGLVPFSESLGLFGDEDRVSGQDLLKSWGAIDEPADSLLSGKGLAGLGVELVADPLNLLFGLGALTKAGRAAKLVGGGLQAADKLAPALKTATSIEDVLPFGRLGEDALTAGGRAAAQVGPATALGSELAKAGQFLKGAGLPMELAPDFVQAGKQGQRAMLGIGGEYAPLIFGPTVNLPEKILAQAPEALGALQATGRAVKALPGVKHVAQLFSRTPAGLDDAQGIAFKDALDEAHRVEQAGLARAAKEAESYDAALRRLPELEEMPGPQAPAGVVETLPPTVSAAPLNDFVDPLTGEILDVPGPVPNATNPAFIREQFAQQRRATLKPWEESAPERLAAETAKANHLEKIADLGIEPGSTVKYTPKRNKYPVDATVKRILPDGRVEIEYTANQKVLNFEGTRKVEKAYAVSETLTPDQLSHAGGKVARSLRAGELADLPPEMQKRVRALEQDANRAIDAANIRNLEEATAYGDPMRRAELRRDFAATHGVLPLESDPIKAKALALPKAIEQAMESGMPGDALGLKTVDFVSADAAMLMPGDKLNLAGDVFTVKSGGPAGKVRLKDGVEILVPDEYVPLDKGSTIERHGVPPELDALRTEPSKLTAAEYKAQNPHTGGALTGNAKAFDALPNDAEVWVFHATSPANAEALVKGGGRVEFMGQGIRGASDAVYVGADPVSVEGYGKELVALRVKKSQLDKAPEALHKGSVGEALVDAGAGAIIEGQPLEARRLNLKNRYVRAHDAFLDDATKTTKTDAPPGLLAQPLPPPKEKTLRETLLGEAEARELRKLAKAEAKTAKIKKAVDTLPPELQAQLDELTRSQDAALRAAEFKTSNAPPATKVPGAAPRPEGTKSASVSGEIHQRLERTRLNERTLEQTVKRLEAEGVPTNDPRWQAAFAERQRLTEERIYLEQWARKGVEPPLKPGATRAEVERAYADQSWKRRQAVESKITKYLLAAGTETRQAAKEAARTLPDASPQVHREITEAIELAEKRGQASAPIRQAAEAVKEKYEEMFRVEQQMAVPTSALEDPRLDYTTRVTTPAGSKFFRGLKAQRKGQLFKNLEEARRARGIATDAAEAAGDPMAKQFRIPPEARKARELASKNSDQAARILRDLDPQTREWIEENGLVSEFLAFGKNAENIHPSQIQRIPQFKGLTIPELNDAFKRVGAKGPVFHENPAAQLFARSARHARAKAAETLFTELQRGLGKELKEGNYGAFDVANGIAEVRTPAGVEGYAVRGIDIDGVTRPLAFDRKKPVIFPDRQTAEAVQQALVKMVQPEEIGPLLKWWDESTQMMKGWVTRAFPAYHVRNRMGNRIQSWLMDVPVVGSHYKAANRALAGLEVEIKTGSGEILSRDDIIREATDNGVLSGGFFEAEFKKQIGEKAPANPLRPNSKALLALERASSAVASAPGQLLSGGGLKGIKDADSAMVEGVDRLGHYLYKRMKGFTPQDAATSTTKALFDYDDISTFEKNVLRRGMFFYTWSRKNLPFMLDRLIQRPGKVRAITQVSGGAGGPREGLPENMPVWMREGLPVPLGKDAEGNPLSIYGFGTPVEGAVEPFAGFAEGPQRGAEKLLSLLNPLLRVPLELATDRRFFLGQDIPSSNKAPHFVKDLPEDLQALLGARTTPTKTGGTRTTMDPYLLYMLENLPAGRAIGTASKAADERKPMSARLANLLTGIKAVSTDEEKEAFYKQKDAIKRRLKELERQGLVSTPEIFAATDAGKAGGAETAEIKALLSALRAKK